MAGGIYRVVAVYIWCFVFPREGVLVGGLLVLSFPLLCSNSMSQAGAEIFKV
jgi:hypothetical protein